MELYARSRVTFLCTNAPRLPANIVSAASAHKTQNQKCVAAGTVAKMRSSKAKAAAFGPAEKRAVAGVGAPSYTSGVHTWNGAAATLQPSPIRIMASPSSTSGLSTSSSEPILVSIVVPLEPYTSAIPEWKDAVANEPNRKYFIADSVDFSESRRYPARM